MAIAFGIFAIMLGSYSAIAVSEPSPQPQSVAVISALLCVAFLAAAVLVH